MSDIVERLKKLADRIDDEGEIYIAVCEIERLHAKANQLEEAHAKNERLRDDNEQLTEDRKKYFLENLEMKTEIERLDAVVARLCAENERLRTDEEDRQYREIEKAVAAERERCAKICDEIAHYNDGAASSAAESCAFRIRKGE